jgi:hypothetical protein
MTPDDKQHPTHADDIFGGAAYEASLPTRRDFEPWHRPRKQFVREYQWLDQIERMLTDVPLQDNTLKYLGLPGLDLLDLRYFHEHLCEPRDLNLRFLGFNNAANPKSSRQVDLDISLAEVRKLRLVDARSDVIADDVRRIANESSVGWIRTLEFAPYDVINLDLCDGFGNDAPSSDEHETHYDALNALVALQARSKSPWLLLLTTRAGMDHVHQDVLRKLLEKYSANLDGCPAFRAASEELFQLDKLPAIDSLGSNLLPVFICGICKWILGLALALKPPCKVELKSVVGYHVEQDAPHEDLVSIAIRFSPVFSAVPDGLGLSQNHRAALDECHLAERILRRVAKRVDADAVLLEKPELKDAMVNATAKLLAVARYDADAYRAWAYAP